MEEGASTEGLNTKQQIEGLKLARKKIEEIKKEIEDLNGNSVKEALQSIV